MANPLLALAVETPDIAGNFARGQAQQQELQTARLGNVLQQYKLDQARKADERSNALAQLYQQHGPGLVQGDEGALSALAKVDPETAVKMRGEAVKANADTFKSMVDRAEFIGRSAQSILQAPPAARPLLYARSLQQAKDMGIDVSKAPPQYDEAAVSAMRDNAVSVKDQLNAWQQSQTAQETARHNKATEANTRRGQDIVDARTRESNSATGWRLMSPEEKKAAGLPTDSAYQTNAQGKIERVAGNTSVRPIPAPAVAGIQGNRRALEKINRAIKLIQENEGSMGAWNYLGDTVRQRTDPKGVTVRAAVADIGSQKIHDRSGAAVTAAEQPRLLPFIPQATDTPQAAIDKLRNLAMEYQANIEDAESFYSPEAGYMSVPERGGAKGANANAGGKEVSPAVIDFNDLPDG